MAKGSTKARTAGDGLGGAEPASLPKVAPVPGTKILLRRSGVKGKLPTAGDAEYGELFINYHSGDPMLCFKDNSDNIVEIKPARAVDGGGGEAPPDTGNTVGDLIWDGTHLFVWDGAAWQAVGPGSLAYVQAADKGTITNTAGDGCDIPLVNNLQAGLMSPGDKNKLDGYPASPDDIPGTLDLQAVTDNGSTTTNGATFGSVLMSTDYNSGSSTGHGYWIDPAGYFVAQRIETQASQWSFQTRLGAEITGGMYASGRGVFGSGNITLNADGSAGFSGLVEVSNAVKVDRTATDQTAFQADLNGVKKVEIKAGGDADFAGRIDVGAADRTSDTASGSAVREDGILLLQRPSGTPGNAEFFEAFHGKTQRLRFECDGSASFASGNIQLNADGTGEFSDNLYANTLVGTGVNYYSGNPVTNANAATTNLLKVFNSETSTNPVLIKCDGTADFAGSVTADTFKYSGSAPSPAMAGKEIDLVKTIELMAAKLAELGGVDIETLFVAEDPAPVAGTADLPNEPEAGNNP